MNKQEQRERLDKIKRAQLAKIYRVEPDNLESILCSWKPIEDSEDSRCEKCEQVLPTKSIMQFAVCPKIVGVRGLGDLVAKGLKMVGVGQKEGCGCGETQNKLNEVFPL